MPFDKPTRNALARIVGAVREILKTDIVGQLQSDFRLQPDGTTLSFDGLPPSGIAAAQELHELLLHYAAQLPLTRNHKARIENQKTAFDRLAREIGFTILNRLAALRLCEERGLVVECVRRGMASEGFQLFERLSGGGLGTRYSAYRIFLENLYDELAIDLGALFDRNAPLSHVFPSEHALEEIMNLLNDPALSDLWKEDETIGWIYQYYNDEVERKKMRNESQAPRNSRELAVRNQFFTPRYVVEFLTDNTLGSLWYEMRGGETRLAEVCLYLVRRPEEKFIAANAESAQNAQNENSVRSKARQKKDPREITMLDPAGGSGHFGLYCFDIFEIIYQEAYADPELRPILQADYPDHVEYLRHIPCLILAHNIHIIDIDPRAVQIAALALWLRAQRSFQRMGLKANQRPQIRKVNVVCAEPMPGERDLLDEFAVSLQPSELGELVRFVFDRMQLAGEAGSLLKIEENLREAIEVLRKKTGPLFEGGEDFWTNAEARVLDALRDYAEQAANGKSTRRRLFADDAAHGFAFIDLCRKHYDVALMNPPFGWSPTLIKDYQESVYPNSKNDLYCMFVERMIEIATQDGMIGSLTSRTGFFLPSMRLWREKVLFEMATVDLMADLGFEVLDNAFVETAAFVISVGKTDLDKITFFLRLNESLEKEYHLAELIKNNAGYFVRKNALKQLPGYPFSYWISSKVRQLFGDLPSLEKSDVKIAVGLVSGDNERFLRLRWEVPPTESRWIPYPKGGDYSKYHQDIYLAVDWGNDGSAIKTQVANKHGSASRFVQNTNFYGQPGLTYPNISVKGFSVRILPAGCIFSHVGQGIFTDSVDKWFLLGILNSSVVEFLLRSLTPSRKWDSGFVKAIPLAIPDFNIKQQISNFAVDIYHLVLDRDLADETTIRFKDLFLSSKSITVREWINGQLSKSVESNEQIARSVADLNKLALLAYGLEPEDIRTPNLSAEQLHTTDTSSEDTDTLEEYGVNDNELGQRLTSYLLGLTVGRWDIRISLDPTLAPKLQDPFDHLPLCPPSMLVGLNGLPVTPGNIVSEAWLRARPNAITLPEMEEDKRTLNDGNPTTILDSEYPLRIAWDGVLVDDPGPDGDTLHDADIVRRLREALAVLWGDRADSIEIEVCELLGVNDLRDYLRKPSGFFADHLKRYSKSRRQAPIYWPLSTASGGYTVWVYYHRLTADTLHIIVNRYVTPKIERTQQHTEVLAEKLADASGKAATDLRDRLGDAKNLLSELADFRTELLRIAALPYKPNLNDGVILNASPLYKLFRLSKWAKDCKVAWDKLATGDYDWAHIAYNIWPERVKKVCETDHSIAIAHDLEHLCKVEVRKPKVRRKKKDTDEEAETIEMNLE